MPEPLQSHTPGGGRGAGGGETRKSFFCDGGPLPPAKTGFGAPPRGGPLGQGTEGGKMTGALLADRVSDGSAESSPFPSPLPSRAHPDARGGGFADLGG